MKKRNILFLMLSTVLLFYAVGAMAQETKSAKKPTPRPPIYGIPAKTLPQGRWIFRGYWIHPFYDQTLSNETGGMINMPENMRFTTDIGVLKIRYGITPRLTGIVNLPYASKDLVTPKITKTGNGLGDMVDAVLWKLHQNKEKKFITSLLFYAKVPVGKSTGLGPDDLPLGTGSFDVGLALLPEKEFGKWDMRWSAFYILRNRNKSGINLGDVTQFAWSTAYNFNKTFITEVSLVYKHSGDNKKKGSLMAGTGTHQLQFIPGAEVRLAQTFLVQLAVPVTLDSKMSFDSTVGTWLGLYYLF